jgi:hypothetical protein
MHDRLIQYEVYSEWNGTYLLYLPFYPDKEKILKIFCEHELLNPDRIKEDYIFEIINGTIPVSCCLRNKEKCSVFATFTPIEK